MFIAFVSKIFFFIFRYFFIFFIYFFSIFFITALHSFDSRLQRALLFWEMTRLIKFLELTLLMSYPFIVVLLLWYITILYTIFPRLDTWESISRSCVACPASKEAQASIWMLNFEGVQNVLRPLHPASKMCSVSNRGKTVILYYHYYNKDSIYSAQWNCHE